MVEGGVSNRAEPAPGGGGSHPHLHPTHIYTQPVFTPNPHLRLSFICTQPAFIGRRHFTRYGGGISFLVLRVGGLLGVENSGFVFI